ncbi:MAG: hypothetical protein NWE92_03520 [Candidatus Bathyarchaeota archaeon]|nr:hypothetical protein [Candidatus Bathyarchaeota archaeon]
MVWVDETQALMNLGVSAGQSKVYLALLRLGADSRVYAIAKLSNVPRQDVYRLLEELERLGIVQKTLDHPARFSALSPKDAANMLLERRRNELADMEQQAGVFVKQVRPFGNEAPPQSDQFFLAREREAVSCSVLKSFEKAERTMRIVTPVAEFLPWLTITHKAAMDALNRGVSIFWITNQPREPLIFPGFLKDMINHKNFSYRLVNSPPKAKVGIMDASEVILGLFADSAFLVSPSLWSNNPSMVAIADHYFQSLWRHERNQKVIKPIFSQT